MENEAACYFPIMHLLNKVLYQSLIVRLQVLYYPFFLMAQLDVIFVHLFCVPYKRKTKVLVHISIGLIKAIETLEHCIEA